MFLGQSHDASAKSKSNQLNRLSAYYATQLLTKEWMQPVSEQHEIFPVTINETKNGAPGCTAPDHNCVCGATTGQAVGPARNQQESQTRRTAQGAV